MELPDCLSEGRCQVDFPFNPRDKGILQELAGEGLAVYCVQYQHSLCK